MPISKLALRGCGVDLLAHALDLSHQPLEAFLRFVVDESPHRIGRAKIIQAHRLGEDKLLIVGLVYGIIQVSTCCNCCAQLEGFGGVKKVED